MKRIALIFLFISSLSNIFAQIDEEFQIKDLTHTGFRIGQYAGNTILEFGVGKILIDMPCNHNRHNNFAPLCGFPKKLELDATFEINFEKFPLFGQKLTLLYTPMAWNATKDFNHKLLYYTIGHALAGINIVHYSPNITKYGQVFLRPEISWMAPQRIKLFHHSDKLELNLRFTYAYNVIGSLYDIYLMSRHQFGVTMLFLYTRKHHQHKVNQNRRK